MTSSPEHRTAEGQSDRAATPGSNQPASDATPSAIRTSLAQRFATARSGATTPPIEAEATAVQNADASPLPQAGASSDASASSAANSAAAPAGGTTRPSAAPKPAAQPAPASISPGPRRVRLALARIDPWSVMKLSFLLSIAIGIGIIVAAAAMWFVLDSMHVFADIRELLVTLDSDSFLTLLEYAEFDRVLSMAAIIAVIDVFLLTALGTLGAFLYNIVAALVGGLHVTFTDE